MKLDSMLVQPLPEGVEGYVSASSVHHSKEKKKKQRHTFPENSYFDSQGGRSQCQHCVFLFMQILTHVTEADVLM